MTEQLTGMQDAAIIVAVICSFVAGMIVLAIFRSSHRLENALSGWQEKPPVPATNWPVALILAAVMLILVGWIGERTDEARIADAAMSDQRISRLLAKVRCPAADEPLEKLVGPMASQADGKAPRLSCVYVTADLGVIPRIRYASAEVIK
jgi:hypothetical protein